jgi:hypothetical protein
MTQRFLDIHLFTHRLIVQPYRNLSVVKCFDLTDLREIRARVGGYCARPARDQWLPLLDENRICPGGGCYLASAEAGSGTGRTHCTPCASSSLFYNSRRTYQGIANARLHIHRRDRLGGIHHEWRHAA